MDKKRRKSVCAWRRGVGGKGGGGREEGEK
jgi:hypothetical protein